MMITEKQLKNVFALLPSVNVFLNDSECSLAFASSLKDVGGRGDDVLYNIMHVRLKKKIINTVNISIEDFYSLGSRTIIQINIGGDQKPIEDIVKIALDTAFTSEIYNRQSDYFRLINYYTNLRNIVCILSPDNTTELADKINQYITFVYWSLERGAEGKGYIKYHYDLFRAGAFTPENKVRLSICNALDLYNILSTDEGIVPKKTIYPINMRYINGKFSTEIVGCISNACYKITSFTCEERDISNIDIDNNDSLDEFIDKVFSDRAAELIYRIIFTEYFMISIFAERTTEGDILIKFVDNEVIFCLARISPTKETIIW